MSPCVFVIRKTLQEDGKRILTELGRQQAALTGQRLATWLDADFPIRSVRVSDMTRAKETAAIITTYLPGVQMEDPDPMLNEGRYVNSLFVNDERHPIMTRFPSIYYSLVFANVFFF